MASFFDVAIGGERVGRIIFKLYGERCPRTVENFNGLCMGTQGPEGMLSYRGSEFHRIVDTFMLQGGDITRGDGTGGESIYGADFADEDVSHKVDSAGLLCMANRGPNTNNSQFFITLAAQPHLDGKTVVFGRVVKGMEIVEAIAKVDVDDDDRPVRGQEVRIENCGLLQRRKREADTSVDADTVMGQTSGGARRRQDVAQEQERHGFRRDGRERREDGESREGRERRGDGESREGWESREVRKSREGRDGRESREPKEARGPREGREVRSEREEREERRVRDERRERREEWARGQSREEYRHRESRLDRAPRHEVRRDQERARDYHVGTSHETGRGRRSPSPRRPSPQGDIEYKGRGRMAYTNGRSGYNAYGRLV